jgi:hypothetical protein
MKPGSSKTGAWRTARFDLTPQCAGCDFSWRGVKGGEVGPRSRVTAARRKKWERGEPDECLDTELRIHWIATHDVELRSL